MEDTPLRHNCVGHSGRTTYGRSLGMAVAGTMLVGGLMALARPAAAQAIHACVRQNNGNIRIVADGVTCAAAENPLSWNVSGPAGPAGPPGPQGPPGIESTYVKRAEAGPNPDAQGNAVAKALCNPGDLALGGGGGGGTSGKQMGASRPTNANGSVPAAANPAGWLVVFTPFSHDAFVEVVCAKIVRPSPRPVVQPLKPAAPNP